MAVYRSGGRDLGPRVARCGYLDAVVVATPVDDALLDGFGFEVLGEGFADKSGKFGVGGEAEGDELFDGELVDVSAVFGGEESVRGGDALRGG